ncbi:hypothetical protein [Flavihumibacter petaseus]|uniref:hypothetical protein n=1 Tax=Flavihumibacter petaseus TaxID=549295 RepID=UPI0012FB1975|nr:hypothetical protein [Flavihumibacter petaseus]
MSSQDFYNSVLETYSDGQCRNSQFSPYAAIAIDPFKNELPGDGGYPSLKSYYRGEKSQSGSTGIRVEGGTIEQFIVGVVTSPNGFTLNAEICTFENITLRACKIGFAGTQPQEKMNRILHLKVIGPVHTLFGFAQYGRRQPGNWIIDDVEASGEVNSLIYRFTVEYFPLYINNLRTESLGAIGTWQTFLSDALTNSTIKLAGLRKRKNLPDPVLLGGGINIVNTTIAYEDGGLPVIFAGKEMGATRFDEQSRKSDFLIWESFKQQKFQASAFIRGIPISARTIVLKRKDVKGPVKVGALAIFYEGNYNLKGTGIVTKVNDTEIAVGQLSEGAAKGKANWLGFM